jgi:hypothetical protein
MAHFLAPYESDPRYWDVTQGSAKPPPWAKLSYTFGVSVICHLSSVVPRLSPFRVPQSAFRIPYSVTKDSQSKTNRALEVAWRKRGKGFELVICEDTTAPRTKFIGLRFLSICWS